jgi:hypothetical protein
MQFHRKCRHELEASIEKLLGFLTEPVANRGGWKTPVLLGNPTPESHSESPPLGYSRFLPLFGPTKGRNCGKNDTFEVGENSQFLKIDGFGQKSG